MKDIKAQLMTHIDAAAPGRVWVPADFSHLGGRDAVDKALQRLVTAGQLRRIDRGLYDRPRVNSLTEKTAAPDYRALVDTIARRDQLRLLVDGNDRCQRPGPDGCDVRTCHHPYRRRQHTIQLDNLTITFKLTAPNRLHWAGRPAMRVVHAALAQGHTVCGQTPYHQAIDSTACRYTRRCHPPGLDGRQNHLPP